MSMHALANRSRTAGTLRQAKAAPVTEIAVAEGDGIGPEIMEATLRVLSAAGARLTVQRVEVGARVYARGHTAGISPEAWEALRSSRVLLKGPITTPQGEGMKSLNVTLRKTLGLYANVRPCASYHPFVETRHPIMDLVIVRENEEDVYAGIEHRQTAQVVQCLKLVSVPGTERIVRYAFEYARRNGRRKVSCFTKDNIMKLTDGLFHRIFEEIGEEYPEIQREHLIVDIGAARLADTPGWFDVVVLPNLYGDILSDVAAQISGSVGMAPSANIGERFAMFEAVHGSAPSLAGLDVANPSGLLLSAVMMLAHIGQPEVAERVHNAWLRTLEDGILTADMPTPAASAEVVGTRAFADSVIARLGQRPYLLRPASYGLAAPVAPTPARTAPRKELVGVDVFLDAPGADVEALATRLRRLSPAAMRLTMITNRGVKVWPGGQPETFCTDHWRCRFMTSSGAPIPKVEIVDLLTALEVDGLDFIKTEHLCLFDGRPGFSLGQGE